MSSNKNNNVTSQGTNSQGNNYTTYESGAYRYSNSGSNGEKASSQYYNTGKGHAFYRQNNSENGPGYSFHENQNQGYRNYQSKGDSSSNKKWKLFVQSIKLYFKQESNR